MTGKPRLALVTAIVASLTATSTALAYWTTSGSGSGTAHAGALDVPTIDGAAPGAATVSLNWSTVIPPAVGAVTYYVTRDDGDVGGDCATAASPAAATHCTDAGLAAGTHHYIVTAQWHSWTAASPSASVVVALAPAG